MDGTWRQADFPDDSFEYADLYGVWGDSTGAYAYAVGEILGGQSLIAFSSELQTWRAISSDPGQNGLRRIAGVETGDLFAVGVGAIWHCATACN